MEMELNRVHNLRGMSKYNMRKCKEMQDPCLVRQGNHFGKEKHRRKYTIQSDSERERPQSNWKREKLEESNGEFRSQWGHCGALCQWDGGE